MAHRINAVNKIFELFVKNVVIKIPENLKLFLWNYCNTKDIPVDIIARFRPHDLPNNSL